MADVHSPSVRSYNMSKIGGKNTKPEIIVRKFLFSKGFRFRLHKANLPGKPDIVLPKYKTVIFINGCFWHGHNHCKYSIIPQTRTQWWSKKIEINKSNDKKNKTKLTRSGWRVLTIWGCQLRGKKIENTLIKLKQKLLS
jgi:DNA mismatch endonuclease (patch repair protein)